VPTRRLRPVAVIAGLAFSIFLSYLAVRDVDLDTFADALVDSSYWWIAPSLAALAMTVAIRVIRWRYLFSAETRPPTKPALRALLIGEFFNAVLPMRPGELARIVVLHRETRTSRPEALGSIVVERLLDVFVLLILLLTGLVAVALTAASWLAVAVSFWLAIRGLGLELGYDAAVLVVAATTFSLVLPSLPASLGVFEAAAVISLAAHGVDDSRALACAVVLHVLSFLPFIAAGLAALALGGAITGSALITDPPRVTSRTFPVGAVKGDAKASHAQSQK
jgi:uncharacterized membrane protein YbhN (UPF0104 family)